MTRRRTWLLVAGLTLVLGAFAGSSALAAKRGEDAPAFSGTSLFGADTLNLEDYRGKVVYVDFWASWCPPCLTSLPLLEELQREFGAKGFQVLAINVDRDPDAARGFMQKRKITYPSLSDPEGELPRRFGLETMPTSYLIDREGRIHWIHKGFKKGDFEKIRSQVRGLVEHGAETYPAAKARPMTSMKAQKESQ